MSVQTPTLLLAAEAYNRYPGELATYHLQFCLPEQGGLTLQFAIPKVLEIESYQLPEGIPASLPTVVQTDDELIVKIPLDKHFEAGKTYEIVTRARIHTFSLDQFLVAEASLIGKDGTTLAAETVQVAVFAKAKYLQHLPEIYESDDFTSRFLMLCESFWKPVSQQIEQGYTTFDPDLTPAVFLPWLASWVGLPLDATLPLDRVRQLIKQALMLFQCRGTNQALKTFLEIYTGGQVEVDECLARNFVLGAENSLGLAVALGKENQPNMVRINLRVSQAELEHRGYSDSTYQRRLEEIIQMIVPAHITFNLSCNYI